MLAEQQAPRIMHWKKLWKSKHLWPPKKPQQKCKCEEHVKKLLWLRIKEKARRGWGREQGQGGPSRKAEYKCRIGRSVMDLVITCRNCFHTLKQQKNIPTANHLSLLGFPTKNFLSRSSPFRKGLWITRMGSQEDRRKGKI